MLKIVNQFTTLAPDLNDSLKEILRGTLLIHSDTKEEAKAICDSLHNGKYSYERLSEDPAGGFLFDILLCDLRDFLNDFVNSQKNS